MKKAGFVLVAIFLGCFAICFAAGEDTPASLEEQIAALEERLESAGIISIEPFLGTWEGKRVDGTTMTLSVSAYDEVNGKVSINLFDIDGELYAFSQGVGQANSSSATPGGEVGLESLNRFRLRTKSDGRP